MGPLGLGPTVPVQRYWQRPVCSWFSQQLTYLSLSPGPQHPSCSKAAGFLVHPVNLEVPAACAAGKFAEWPLQESQFSAISDCNNEEAL